LSQIVGNAGGACRADIIPALGRLVWIPRPSWAARTRPDRCCMACWAMRHTRPACRCS